MIEVTYTCKECGVTTTGSMTEYRVISERCVDCYMRTSRVHYLHERTPPLFCTLRYVKCTICGETYIRQPARPDSGICSNPDCRYRTEIPPSCMCQMVCMVCGETYLLEPDMWMRERFKTRHFCSDRCKSDYLSKPPKICIYCSTLYHTPVYGSYCSHDCLRRHRMVMGHINSSDD